jgi:hypothetical protein
MDLRMVFSNFGSVLFDKHRGRRAAPASQISVGGAAGGRKNACCRHPIPRSLLQNKQLALCTSKLF